MDVTTLRSLWPLEQVSPPADVSITVYADPVGFAVHCNVCHYILIMVPWNLAADLDAQRVLDTILQHNDKGKHQHA